MEVAGTYKCSARQYHIFSDAASSDFTQNRVGNNMSSGPALLLLHARSPALPPGPRMPSTLQAVAWARRPLPFLERCQKHFGDIFTIRVKHAGTWVILADPEDVKKVFTADHAVLGVGLANSILGPLLGPRSVMLLEEPEHVKRRKLMLPPFHGERMKGYSEMMAEVTRRELATWPVGEPFELWPRMQEITLEAIMRVVFGPVETESLQRLRVSLRRLTNWMNDPKRLNLLAAAGPSRFAGNKDYRAMMGPVEQGVLEQVRLRRQDPGYTDGTDIAAMLGEARYEDGSPMTEQDLRDELVTLLDGRPHFQPDLMGVRADSAPSGAVRALAGGGRHAERRARGPTSMPSPRRRCGCARRRRSSCASCLSRWSSAGTRSRQGRPWRPACTWCTGGPTSTPSRCSFRPERFLERPAGTYTWIPFGGGVRRCLAAPYAQLLMKQVIGTVIAEVDLRAVEPRSERARKSAIAFVPHRHALAMTMRRTPDSAYAQHDGQRLRAGTYSAIRGRTT